MISQSSGTSPPHYTHEQSIRSLLDKQGKDDIEKSLVRLWCLLKILNNRFHYQFSQAEIVAIDNLMHETYNTYLDYVLEDI